MPPKPGTCPVCGKVFHNSSNVKPHMMTHTNERPFKCSVCGSAHRRKASIKRHICHVHSCEKRVEKQVECIMCQKTMTNSNLNKHLGMHVREKPYSCSICDLDFPDSSNLKRHLKSHEKLKGDPCIFCEKTLSICSNPNEHIISHIKEKPYFCKRCPSSFSHRGSLGVHIRAVHLKERRYSCELCKNTYCSKGERDKHMSVHLNEKPFQCTICFKRLESSWGLKCHLDSHKDMQKPKFPCDKCGKIYNSQSNLSRHDKANHQLTQCILCEKNITTDLMTHLLKHTNERPFPCNSCEKDFRNLTNLNSHILHIHSTERPNPCEICGNSFKSKKGLQSHIKSHLNEKPFPCTLCPKRLATSHNLKMHLKTHSRRFT